MELIEIGAAAELTGLSKETLRKWEDRYGFPIPKRSTTGRRVYTAKQISQLQTLKNLLDRGVAPRFIVGLSPIKLQNFLENLGPYTTKPLQLTKHWTLGSPSLFRDELNAAISQHGLVSVVNEYLPDIQHKIGIAWASGELAIWEEHVATEVISRVLRNAIANNAYDRIGPKILLATPPGELHTMGLLMLEAALNQDGADCLYVGAELPIKEIIGISHAHDIQIVALSFSIGFPRKKIAPFLTQLRDDLPEDVNIWVGGGAIPVFKKPLSGVQEFHSIKEAIFALSRYRSNRQSTNHMASKISLRS